MSRELLEILDSVTIYQMSRLVYPYAHSLAPDYALPAQQHCTPITKLSDARNEPAPPIIPNVFGNLGVPLLPSRNEQIVLPTQINNNFCIV